MVAYPHPRVEPCISEDRSLVAAFAGRIALPAWWPAALVTIAGAGLGGYMGSVLALLAWLTAGRIARNPSLSTARRCSAALLGLALWAGCYAMGLQLYVQLLRFG